MIIDHLQNTKVSPLLLEKKSKRKYNLSFDLNMNNVQFICDMLKRLFNVQKIHLELGLFNASCSFGNGDLHLLDLYEMGYMSMTSIIYDKYSFMNQLPFPIQLFTGLFVNANNPFLKFPYDFIELNYSINSDKKFLLVSLDMLLQQHPHVLPNIDAIILRIVESLPLRERSISCILLEWKNTFTLEIRPHDFMIPINEWKEPCVFLKHISSLLDYFPPYYIEPQFHLETIL